MKIGGENTKLLPKLTTYFKDKDVKERKGYNLLEFIIQIEFERVIGSLAPHLMNLCLNTLNVRLWLM